MLLLNRQTVAVHGGSFVPPANLLHEEQLDYLIEIVSSEIAGEALYPSVADKAGLYCHAIISNHLFQDGNKRTGIVAALVFLKLNGFRLQINVNQSRTSNSDMFNSIRKQRLYKFTIAVASSQYTLREVQDWFALNTEEVAS